MFNIEIQRNYLASRVPEEISGVEPVHMVDVFFPADVSVESHLRARRYGDSYELTKLIPVVGSHSTAHLEQSISLDPAEFESVIAGNHRAIVKDRFNVRIAGLRAEVDVFRGRLEGLVIIEISFEDEVHTKGYAPPLCCGADVTDEEFIVAGQLAGKSFEDLAPVLEPFHYQRLRI